jgi:hypothetical protein
MINSATKQSGSYFTALDCFALLCFASLAMTLQKTRGSRHGFSRPLSAGLGHRGHDEQTDDDHAENAAD